VTETLPWVPLLLPFFLRQDRAACTVNVALSDDRDHAGGRRVALAAAGGAFGGYARRCVERAHRS
jgi:hypothetical protein